MNARFAVPYVLPVLLALASGCAERPREHTVQKVPAGSAAELPQSKAEFEALLREKLDRLDAEVQELEVKAEKLEAKARAKWDEEMAELDAKRKAAREKFDSAVRSTTEAFGHLREGAAEAWEDLEAAVRKARAEW